MLEWTSNVLPRRKPPKATVTVLQESSSLPPSIPDALWTAAGPASLADLPMHSTKLRAIRQWMEDAMGEMNRNGTSCSMLVLAGRSGTCKRSAVELLAKEMKVNLVLFNEDLITTSDNNSHDKESNQYYHTRKKYREDHLQDFSSTSYYVLILSDEYYF